MYKHIHKSTFFFISLVCTVKRFWPNLKYASKRKELNFQINRLVLQDKSKRQ